MVRIKERRCDKGPNGIKFRSLGLFPATALLRVFVPARAGRAWSFRVSFSRDAGGRAPTGGSAGATLGAQQGAQQGARSVQGWRVGPLSLGQWAVKEMLCV